MNDLNAMDALNPAQRTPPPGLEAPLLCAECGLQMRSAQLADECELCGAPRCHSCAVAAGDGGHFICDACAAESQ